MADFVRIMAEAGELTRWTVALIGSERGIEHHLAENIPVGMLKRTSTRDGDKFSIGRLMSPRDESVDLDEASWNAALALTRANWKPDPARSKGREEPDVPNGPSMRQVRGFGADGIPPSRDRGLLLLYVIDPEISGWKGDCKLPPALAFGISFPGSNGGPKVEYKVGNVYWEQVYGIPD